MNLKKAELRFKRAWENDWKAQGAHYLMPRVVDVFVPTDNPLRDGITITFDDRVTLGHEETIKALGCIILDAVEKSVTVQTPVGWLIAPSRLLSPETPIDRLHNALLDVGVSDWLDIRRFDDEANLIAELFDTLTSNQIDALKPRYDVVLHPANSFIYTFAERVAVAPLVDPATTEKRLRRAWSNAHAGKIATVEATDDPREWIVTTEKAQPSHTGLLTHGIEHQKLIDPKTARVRIGPKIWNELLKAANPIPAVTDTTEAATVADGDTEPLISPEPAPLPELDERDLEIAALKTQVESLQGIIRVLTPVTDEWQTLKLTLPKDGKVTAHPEIAAEQAKGWKIHHIQYAANGEDRLFVFMERRARVEPPRYRMATMGAEASPSYREINSGTITSYNSPLAQAMIADMNDELASSAQALANAFYSTGMFNGN